MRVKWSGFIILFFSFLTCWSQGFKSGFVIKVNSDSVPGMVRYNQGIGLVKKCVFKDANGKVEVFLASDLKAFGYVGDKYYVARAMEQGTEPVFIRMVVRGSTSLLTYDDIYFVERNGAMTRLVKSGKQYVGQLNSFIKDCDMSADAVAHTETQLRNLIRNYNRCGDHLVTVYETNPEGSHLSYDAFIASDYGALTLADYPTYKIGTNVSITGGIGVNVHVPAVSSKMYGLMEVWYVKKSYTGYSEVQSGSSITRGDLNVDVSMLKVPVGVGYVFSQKSSAPYLRAGLAMYFSLKQPSVETLTETDAGGIVYTEKSTKTLPSKTPLGFWGAAGYSFQVTSNLKGFVETRYEINNGLSKGSSASYLNFSIGIKL
jgi:hypothetical protein